MTLRYTVPIGVCQEAYFLLLARMNSFNEIREMGDDEFKRLIEGSTSRADFARKALNASKTEIANLNGQQCGIINEEMNRRGVPVPKRWAPKRRETITKVCPVCSKQFETYATSKLKTTTCSKACGNVYFKSGKKHPMWKQSSYRSTCFEKHQHKCAVKGCGETRILDVHHYDGNPENNSVENLIPLCPTHHRYWHSIYRPLIQDAIDMYRADFIETNLTNSENVVSQ